VRASWGGATPEQVVVVINGSRFPVVQVISGSWLLPTGQFLLTDELTLFLQPILFSIGRELTIRMLFRFKGIDAEFFN
jgi:hypothetical protein